LFSFTIALLISTWSILSIGFLIASIVPTARFAQPIGAVIMYPMIAVSGLFVPIESLPPVLHGVARVLPLGYAVPLLQGIWNGDAWSAHVWRRSGTGSSFCRLHGAFCEGISLGVVFYARKAKKNQTDLEQTGRGNRLRSVRNLGLLDGLDC